MKVGLAGPEDALLVNEAFCAISVTPCALYSLDVGEAAASNLHQKAKESYGFPNVGGCVRAKRKNAS